ncbi:MAG: phosphotransferase [Acidimicrobiia bacterium]|nr:phosphotransferase [Acidimicrobiia bacterium]NNL28273.1 aminoglycoside phosphotransferase family protein [Acidimicrobiia bacterium]
MTVEVLQEGRSASSVYRFVLDSTGPAIIAKNIGDVSDPIERNIYEQVLPLVGIDGPTFLGVAHRDHERWLFTSEVTGQPYDEKNPAHRSALAHWLGTLHSDVVREPANLPDKSSAHYLELLHSAAAVMPAIQRRETTTARVRRVIDLVLRQYARLESHWPVLEEYCIAAPRTMVHGDLVSHNVFIQDDLLSDERCNAVMVIDWEKAGWGTPAEDLSAVDLAVYRARVHDRWPHVGPEVWEHVATAGRFFRCLVFVDWVLSRWNEETGIANLELGASWLEELSNRQRWS